MSGEILAADPRIRNLRDMLHEAESLPDLRKIVDHAAAVAEGAKRAGLAEEAQREWGLFSLEAQRHIGKLLAAMPKNPGARRSRGDSVSPRLSEVLDTKTDAEAKQKAKRWQDVGAIPDDVYDAYTKEAKEPTRARLLRLARDAAAASEREQQAREDAARVATVPPTVDLRHGDFRTTLADLTDVAAIITDPPYPREFLPLYSDLAAWADKVLAPDGVLVVLSGQTHLPEVIARLNTGRPYRWTCAYMTPGNGYVSHPRRVQSNWKPILVYGDGPRVADVFTTSNDDKQHHHWGQDFTAFSDIVSRFTRPGQLVADPFLGGGTTAAACVATDRHFVGCDIDPEAVATSTNRLKETP